MANTIGYHVVLSAYGLWLPGDDRGSWSAAWDEKIGHTEPHTLHPGNPVRKRMAEERMKHPPVRFDGAMIDATLEAITECVGKSDWSIAAASLESTHAHLLLTYTARHFDNTVKWIKDQTTKAVHRKTPHVGPVWCKGKWRCFVYDQSVWQNAMGYIERHNVRRNVGPRPYSFITCR